MESNTGASPVVFGDRGGSEGATGHHGYCWRRCGDHEGVDMVTAMCHATWWCIGWCLVLPVVWRSSINKWRQVANDKETAVDLKMHIGIVK